LPPPGTVGSKVDESSLERSDFDGNADWENGVIGDAKLAEVLAPPAAFPENDVLSCGGAWLALLTGVGGLCMTDSAMYVSKHFARKSKSASAL
jgi:hypothetical protein